MGEGFPLFLFSFFTSLLCKYCVSPFFVYHMFVRPLSCTYLYNFIVYALQLTISYNANQKATFRSYIAKSSRMNIRAHKNISAAKIAHSLLTEDPQWKEKDYWFKVSKGFKKNAKETEVRAYKSHS